MWRLRSSIFSRNSGREKNKYGRWAAQINILMKKKKTISSSSNWSYVTRFTGGNTIGSYFPLSICTQSFQLQIQCSVFEGAIGDVALTSGGGLRRLPGLNETFESVALIGIHYGGIFYEFVPWNARISWEITPWGKWHISAESETHIVELEATTEGPGTTLRAPTEEMGLAPACRDTCFGDLRLQLWEWKSNGRKGKVILDVTSNMAGLEVGGGPWFNTWKEKAQTPEIVTRAINVPVDLDSVFSLVPLLKPPGL